MSTVLAYVPDLMDRSKVAAACPRARFVGAPSELVGSVAPDAVVIVDLSRPGVVDILSELQPARVVGFVSHLDRATVAAAKAAGCEAMARSEFFRRIGELTA